MNRVFYSDILSNCESSFVLSWINYHLNNALNSMLVHTFSYNFYSINISPSKISLHTPLTAIIEYRHSLAYVFTTVERISKIRQSRSGWYSKRMHISWNINIVHSHFSEGAASTWYRGLSSIDPLRTFRGSYFREYYHPTKWNQPFVTRAQTTLAFRNSLRSPTYP